MDQYIGLDAVKDAFHVESEFFAVDNAEGFDYTATEKDLTGFYKSINGKLRVLVYNGKCVLWSVSCIFYRGRLLLCIALSLSTCWNS